MDNLKLFLNQVEKSSNGAPFPYQTNFSFLSKYPYKLIKIGIPNWVRLDGVGSSTVGTSYAWKLLCIFNDLVDPFDLLDREFIYIPENFSLAVNWIKQINKNQSRQ